jgi:hypothetical protein
MRCEIREKLIAYVQKHYPASLPRTRVDFGPKPPTMVMARQRAVMDENGNGHGTEHSRVPFTREAQV